MLKFRLLAGPRARNSIAVSSTEHLKNGNKRPHSLISLSSTSSSSSSNQSSSYAAVLTGGGQLACMLESPYEDVGGAREGGAREAATQVTQAGGEIPRSATMCSNGGCIVDFGCFV